MVKLQNSRGAGEVKFQFQEISLHFKNNIARMKIYIWGILLTGLPPLIWGGYLHYDDLMKHINGTGYRRTIMGYPRAIVIFGFILCFGEVKLLNLRHF